VLVPGEAPPPRALRGLAARLRARLGHAVEAWPADPTATPPTAIGRRVARGTARLVVLPVAVSPAGRLDRHVDAMLAGLAARWPRLCIHRGLAPGQDDVARLLGDRAREAAAALGLGGRDLGAVVVVIVDAGGASPARNAELAGLCRLVYEAHRFAEVAYAFLELTTPGVAEVVERWARLGARALVVVPRTLFASAAHRRIVREARAAAARTGIAIALGRPLGSHPLLVGALARRHVEALRAGSLTTGHVTTAPYVRPHLLQVLRHAHGASPLGALDDRVSAILPPRYREPGAAVSPAPMGAAPLVFGPDGEIAWDQLWQGFCELALAGGPPHRGTLLEAPPRDETLADPERYREVRRELARGIRLVTGLEVRLDTTPGWIGVVCASEAMAIWLMRAIVVENVMARREGPLLLLPAGPRFTLAGEIKNVVTALAKSHHYWIEHLDAQEGGAPEAVPPDAAR
jgi:sirohydrochlorin cobaltochelatase